MTLLFRSTLTDGGLLFGENQLTTLLKAEVGIGDDFWIIYAYLPPPKQGDASFDIGQIISNAFDLGLTNFHIIVENAGFFQLKGTSANYNQIASEFSEIPFPIKRSQDLRVSGV